MNRELFLVDRKIPPNELHVRLDGVTVARIQNIGPDQDIRIAVGGKNPLPSGVSSVSPAHEHSCTYITFHAGRCRCDCGEQFTNIACPRCWIAPEKSAAPPIP